MALVPLSYNARSLFVRRSATALTVASIGATVAVVAGVLALQQGFATLYTESGSEDMVIFLRKGATSEGESFFPRERAATLKKSVPEIASGEAGPVASGELYLAMRLRKTDGGETNVPIRGVEQASFDVLGERLQLVEGRRFEPGTDEVIVGRALLGRVRNTGVDQVLLINTTPFRVAGVFACDGPYTSEIWGDAERLGNALERPGFSRIVARLQPGVDLEAFKKKMDSDLQVPTKVLTEKEYLGSQTLWLSAILFFLGGFLGVIMGAGAVFTGTNTMLAALAARSHEIGILLSLGFRPFAIFLSFLFEAMLLGLLGGACGCLLVLPVHGISTGTTNFQTFTEVAFAFRVTPMVLGISVSFAVVLGLLGGLVPAWSAASKQPTEVLRRR